MLPNLTHSSHARLSPVALQHVSLADEFWAPRRRLNRDVTLPEQYRRLEETGRLDNFRRAAGGKEGSFRGYFFNDSDVYKWLEAAAWSLASDPGGELSGAVEAVIELIVAAQSEDGYLNTYFSVDRVRERWGNLRDMHELYCAGHLIQAAIADRRARGSERLLGVARRLADHLHAVFGRQGRPGAPGHPEIEMALVELFRETGETKYLDLAQFFLDERGRGRIGGREYHSDHQPFRELERLAGHAVRALYLCAGAADLYCERGEVALRAALERLWERMAGRQMYVTGGIGARFEGEAFGADWELPNERAYAETCAAIANVLWCFRMLNLDGDARYADLLEWSLYNGSLAGISLDGRSYFYVNPLADPEASHRRQPWYDCACCPTNIVRLLAALPGLFYSTSDEPEGVWVHLYAQGAAQIPLPGGGQVEILQRTDYPWQGEIELAVQGQGERSAELSLFLRIPAWAGQPGEITLEVNGEPFQPANALQPGTYVEIRRSWLPGDQVRLILPQPVRKLQSHPFVLENTGRVALSRGPLVYCLEGADQPGIDLRLVTLPAGASVEEKRQSGRLDGIIGLHFTGNLLSDGPSGPAGLYRPASAATAPAERTHIPFTAIPYYAWANREPGPLQVWLLSEEEITHNGYTI